MNSKKIWLMIPAILNPYLFMLSVTGMLLSAKVEFIIESQFLASYGIFIWYGFFIILGLVSIALTVLVFVLSLKGKWDPLFLSKCAMIIKLIQIPAYILIFVYGVLFAVTVWLFVVSFIAIIVDYITLLMSSSFNIAAIINLIREKKLSFKKSIPLIISQFIYCVDVVGAIILYRKIKKISLPCGQVAENVKE